MLGPSEVVLIRVCGLVGGSVLLLGRETLMLAPCRRQSPACLQMEMYDSQLLIQHHVYL